MLPVIPMDRVLGSGLLGLILSSIIFGITCLQAYLYYTKYSRKDRWPMKLTVAIIWTLDSVQLVLATMMIYHYAVSNWGEVVVLLRTTWSAAMTIACGAVLASVVQFVFARRIWLFSGKNWALTGCIIALSILQLSFGVVFTVQQSRARLVIDIGSKTFKLIASIALSSNIACDTIISMSMCYYLHANRTGFRSTDTMINLLITYAIRTCLLTTICTISCLVTFLTCPNTMIANSFYFIATRLYANSLLSILNARESISDRGRSQGSDIESK